jgi:hypothetical protein
VRWPGHVLLGADGGLRSGWRILLFLVCWWFLERCVWTVAVLALGPGLSWPPVTASALVCLLLTWAFLFLEERPLVSIGLQPDRRRALEFVAGVVLGGAVMGGAALLARAMGGFHWERAGSPWGLAKGGLLFLAVACNEELIFRGYTFQRCREGLGAWPALLLMGAQFAACHWGNPGMAGSARLWASLNIALAGVLLGLAFLRTGSLALPVGLHLGWNWTQGSLLGFGVSGMGMVGCWKVVLTGGRQWITGGTFGLEAGLPCTLTCLAACGLLLAWKGKARSPRLRPG